MILAAIGAPVGPITLVITIFFTLSNEFVKSFSIKLKSKKVNKKI